MPTPDPFRYRLVVLVLFACIRPAIAAPAPGLADMLDASSAGSEAAHDYRSHGTVALIPSGGLVGGNDTRSLARSVAGKGSWIEYRLRVAPGRPVTLEIEELDGRESGVRGYSVVVDGKPVAFRSWRLSGAGPVHWFVELPPPERETITLRLVSAGGAAFRIRRVWAFSDFDAWFDRTGMDAPYYVAPTVGLTWFDSAKDAATVDRIKASIPKDAAARPAFTAAIDYANWDEREVRRRVRYLLELARRVDMPVQIVLDTWWGSTPDGSDGRGGFWTDVPYQQVVYNVSKERHQLSIPNQWSSTPWLTVANPHLNAFKQARLEAACRVVRDAVADLRAEGRGGLLLGVNLDNEPVYWASGNAGLGSDLLQADFNREAVARARRSGVDLDPTDGLDRPERLWLFRNLTAYNAKIAGTAANALGKSVTPVAGDTARPDADPARENLYTQAMVADPALQYPMLDPAWALWETAAPKRARVGGEWNGNTPDERQAILHQLTLGRNAGTNAEAGNDAANMAAVRPGYALGQRFVALYNYPLDRMDRAVSGLNDLSQTWAPLAFMPSVHEETFRDDRWKARVHGHRGVQTGVIGNTAAIAAFPASADAPGILTWRLEPPTGGWKGLFLELKGRARNFEAEADPAVSLRVLAGRDAGALREVRRFHDAGSITEADRVDLGAVAVGGEPVIVRVEMHAPGLRPDLLSWCAVWSVRFTHPWPVETQSPPPVSLRQARRRNLLVSWRADAERSVAELKAMGARGEDLPAAHKACDRGAYAEAYHMAQRAMSATLPAVYRVRDHGPLAPYPIRLAVSRPVTAILEEAGPERFVVAIDSPEPADVSITLTGLEPGAAYRVRRDGGRWWATRVPDGAARADAAGALAWSGAFVPNAAPAPVQMRGTYKGRDASGALLIYPDGGGRARLPIGGAARFRRGAAGETPRAVDVSDFRRGDAVTVRLGADGAAVEVAGAFRWVEGAVRTYQPMTPWEMPSLALADGEPHTLDLYAPLHGPNGTTTAREHPVGTPLFCPGERVRLRVHPATGRIFEAWRDGPTDDGKGADS